MYNLFPAAAAQQRTTIKVTREISANCIVGEGKFHYNNNDSDEPFSAVAMAFGGLCRTVRIHEESSLREMPDSCSSLGDMLVDELGPTTEVLVRLIPELGDLLPATFCNSMGIITSSEDDDEQNKDDTNFIDGAKTRSNYAFRVLTRILCKRFHNLVLILDDMQWADVASLEVIDSLISDVQNRNGLMIIGGYRSDEIDENHLLRQYIQGLQDKKEKQNFAITNIDLPPFSLDQVNEVLMRLMSIDEKDVTQPLAKLCLKRTMGNPHFLIEFLTLLTDENLLVYNLGLLRWTWDENKIEELTMSTKNVVGLLKGRMNKLSSNEQLLLQYAACLGSSFRLDTLKLVWANHTEKSIQNVGLEELMDGLQHGHFIEPDGDDSSSSSGSNIRRYRWVHDNVQEAALSLGRAHEEPSFQLEKFQFEIGMILYKQLDSQELDQTLFDVVDLINRGKAKRRADLATLNLKAAKKARGMSSFLSAFIYTSHGIALLPGDRWAPEHCALTLRLYTLGSQMALATGNFAKLDEYAEEVLSQPDCTLLEKMPVYIAQVERLSATTEYDKAIGMSLKLLKELGCNLVRFRRLVSLQAIASLKKTVRQAKRVSPKQFFEQQPLMENPHQSAIMQLLFKLGYASLFTCDVSMLVLCTTKSVQITLKHGIHDHSATCFARLGTISKTVFGDFASACLFAETAQLLQQRIPNQFYTTTAVLEAYGFVLSWTTPVQSCAVPMLENYTRGLRAGNNEAAMWSLFHYHVAMPYHLGKPLGTIVTRLPVILNQAEEMNLTEHSLILKLCWQFLCNFRERSNEPMKLKGDIFDCDKEEMNIPYHSAMANWLTMVLHLIFGDYEGGAEIALERGDIFEKVLNGDYGCMGETFDRAILCYSAFHKTKHRKHRREAKRIREKINCWKNKRVPNVLHYVVLLDAEQAALEKKYAKADELYKKAITMAARPGRLYHAALFSERYVDFLKRNCHHLVTAEEEIRFRVGEAMRYYTEWGAPVKVEMMKEDWAGYCD